MHCLRSFSLPTQQIILTIIKWHNWWFLRYFIDYFVCVSVCCLHFSLNRFSLLGHTTEMHARSAWLLLLLLVAHFIYRNAHKHAYFQFPLDATVDRLCVEIIADFHFFSVFVFWFGLICLHLSARTIWWHRHLELIQCAISFVHVVIDETMS